MHGSAYFSTGLKIISADAPAVKRHVFPRLTQKVSIDSSLRHLLCFTALQSERQTQLHATSVRKFSAAAARWDRVIYVESSIRPDETRDPERWSHWFQDQIKSLMQKRHHNNNNTNAASHSCSQRNQRQLCAAPRRAHRPVELLQRRRRTTTDKITLL